jgi:hypothetical protein
MGHANIAQTRGYIDVTNADLTLAIQGLDRVLESVSGTLEAEKVWAQNGHTSGFQGQK